MTDQIIKGNLRLNITGAFDTPIYNVISKIYLGGYSRRRLDLGAWSKCWEEIFYHSGRGSEQ